MMTRDIHPILQTKKPMYEKPELVRLGELAVGRADCTVGAGDGELCFSGSGDFDCHTGTAASDTCLVGGGVA